eukprot:CAMPEP_0115566194 /NCGR_PEP_ID=MMETSP0271-20121206/103461_1 /TAXON_ID=71861 /ORGANISM="Scrippsiella trochoidea, Strain CCMP3099" /LENGTH=246 /DNA_ID=CAMNT_0003000499 /DNA_START=83 /DNA_END=820 /DNA_ORIENTATION=-
MAVAGGETSGHLKKHHLSCWQEEGDGLGLPEENVVNKVVSPLAKEWPSMNFKNPNELVMGHIIQNDSKAGLRPGLNSIIRGLTNCLWHEYGVREVFGMQAGYNGLSDPDIYPPIKLTPDFVREIHMKGGSVLKAGRGGFDAEKILDGLKKLGVNMVFLVGGDGTQFAGNLLYEAALKRGQAVSIVGIPKSIDNDVVMFDKTFGFESAVAEASEVIRNGWVEASSCDKGVGIVKLMGRDAGFVAMFA